MGARDARVIVDALMTLGYPFESVLDMTLTEIQEWHGVASERVARMIQQARARK